MEPVWILDEKYAGQPAAEKIAGLRKDMKEARATVHVLTTLDDIVWLLNIRGNDIPFNPVVLSYVAVGARSVEDQQHRLTASGIGIPVGMKNPTSGGMGVMLNSVYAAQHGHEFIFRGWEVKTPWQPPYPYDP